VPARDAEDAAAYIMKLPTAEQDLANRHQLPNGAADGRARNIRDDQTQAELRKLAAEYVAEAEDIEKQRAGIAHRRKRKRPPTEAASWARRGWAGSPANRS